MTPLASSTPRHVAVTPQAAEIAAEVLGLAAPADAGAALVVRSASHDDAEQIATLINSWADAGLTLRRQPAEVADAINEFVVAVYEGRVVACGALVVFSPSLAEIRSIAIEGACKGLGSGKAVVQFLIDQADSVDTDRVVLLTKIPDYFAKFGFHSITASDLPEAFIDEFITARRRTLTGRTIMERTIPRG